MTPFLLRRDVPVHQNILLTTREAARSVTRGHLDFVACEECGFVFNRSFDISRLSYGESYDNTQSYSPQFDAYLDDIVRDMVENQGVRDSVIVEIGCGKGDFLRKLVGYPEANNVGFGFDPSYAGADTEMDGRLVFRRCFYDNTCSDITADIAVCRHVIEHVPDPLMLLRSVRSALMHSPRARVFFEAKCVEWILQKRVIWDFFYEQCSLFSASSLRTALERTGFAVERVEHAFGDQYLWLAAHVSIAPVSKSVERMRTADLARVYRVEESARLNRLLTKVTELGALGRVALWGAGAKGATFANLIDPDCALIDCVVDINPNKQACFIPGTGHPIVAPHDLVRRGVRNAVLMNPNYHNENLRLLTEDGADVGLINFDE